MQFNTIVSHRIDVVFACLLIEERLQFLELFRMLGSQIGGKAEIAPPIGELPDVLVERYDRLGLDHA